MPFPSQALEDFCSNVAILIEAPREGRTCHRDGFCQCEIYRAIQYAPIAQQSQLASGIFWGVWVDQILFYVLIEGGIRGQPDCALYERFREAYPFPKFYSHTRPGHASPYGLLADNRDYTRPTRELLIEDKQGFWGEVSEFLDSLGRHDVRASAEDAFREDLGLRFPRNAAIFSQRSRPNHSMQWTG